MSRREDIDNAIWSDPDFLGLSVNAKLLYVWSFTNPRCGMSGLYKVTREAAAMETGLTPARLADALGELAEGRFVFYDGRWMWVRSRIKHLRSKSPNIAKSIRSDLEAAGEHEYARELAEKYRTLEWVGAVCEGFIGTLRNPSNPSNRSEGFQGKGRAGQLLEGPSSASPSTHTAGVRDIAKSEKPKPSAPDPNELPADLPPRLAPVVDAIVPRLARIAALKAATPPTRARVGRIVADFPDRDHRSLAPEFEDYWTHGAGGSKPMRDIAATYRNRCAQVPPNPAAAAVGAVVALNGAAEPEDEFARQKRLREARERQDRETGARWAQPERSTP